MSKELDRVPHSTQLIGGSDKRWSHHVFSAGLSRRCSISILSLEASLTNSRRNSEPPRREESVGLCRMD
jgi:hypothetical protein